MKQWTRVIATNKKKANLDFLTILNPTYWPIVGDKAKQFHVGDTIKLAIQPNWVGTANGGQIPHDIVKLEKEKNGTTGTILSIDEVQGVPGSDAAAMTIQLNDGTVISHFPAAWLLKI